MKIRKWARTVSLRAVAVWAALLCNYFAVYASSLSSVLIPKYSVILFFQVAGIALIWAAEGGFRKNKIDSGDFFCLFVILLVAVGYCINNAAFTRTANYILMLIFLMTAKRSQRWENRFVKLMAAAGVFYMITTLLMYLDSELYYRTVPAFYPSERRFDWWYQSGFMTGITDHNTTNGCMLSIATIFWFGFWISAEPRSGAKRVYACLTVLAFFCLILTKKRGNLLFSVMGIMLACYFHDDGKKRRFLKYACILTAALNFLLLGYRFMPSLQEILERFQDMSGDENISIRLAMWQAALKAFAENPLLGIGWFGFSRKIAPLVGGRSGEAHCVYLQLACETGIFGTAIFCLWFGYSLFCAVSLLKSIGRKEKSYSTAMKRWIFISTAFQIFILLYAMTENPLYDYYINPVYYAMSIPTVQIYGRTLRREKRERKRTDELAAVSGKSS